MSKIPAIRIRLVTIVLIGVATSALSMVALVRALSITAENRMERVREAVTSELDQLSKLPPSRQALAASPPTTFVALHGGWIEQPDQVGQRAPDLPALWRGPLERALAAGVATNGRIVTETSLEAGTLVVAVQPALIGGFAWTGFLAPPSMYLKRWRWIVFSLVVATGLLVATALWGIVSFRRSTSALHATLVALGKDLTTEVPHPTIAGLAGVADGIRRMAADLLASREATERLLGELAQKDRLAALGRVAAGVAHEVRNPLASIKLRLDLTAAAHALPEAAQKGIEAASHEIMRLDRLVSDLLLVAGKKMGPSRVVDLGELVRARMEALGPWAQTHGVTFLVGGTGGSAHANPESVARAIDNLLRNAVEASPTGGQVDLHVAPGAQSVELYVDDRGPGVEAGRQSELFEPFFTTKGDGTGLGLAISRAIARAHGGDLTYARQGQLTRFSLVLPSRLSSRESGVEGSAARAVAPRPAGLDGSAPA